MKLPRKAFRERISRYEKTRKPFYAYLMEEYLDERGTAVILLDLTGQELYQPLSHGVQRTLHPDIVSFLEEKAYPIPASIPVRIEVRGVVQEEQETFRRMVQVHYDYLAHDKRLDLRLNTVRSWAMYLLGVGMLAVYFALSVAQISTVFYEVLSIAATFVVWEAVDISFLERHALRVAYQDAVQMATAETVFLSTEV